MKNILLFIIFCCSTLVVHAQYLETFSTPNQGVLSGPCSGAVGTSCFSNDFSSVDWTIEGNLTGIDVEPFATTAGGVLSTADIDEEACFVSPVLNISATGSASFSVDLTWLGLDGTDYINVEYSVDGGAYTQLPNQVGGGAATIQYLASGNDGSATVISPIVVGSSLQIRVCIDVNSSGEFVTLDNVSVPNGTVLPVELTSFKGFSNGKENTLEWTTASEENNSHFELQRSENGRDFEAIGLITGAGNTVETSHYNFEDRNPLPLGYYRLKQVDFDGAFEYSDIISVENRLAGKNLIISSVFPNPTFGSISVSLNTTQEEEVNISVSDVRGKTIFSGMYNAVPGENAYTLDLEHLTEGVYFLTVSNGKDLKTQRFVKSKK